MGGSPARCGAPRSAWSRRAPLLLALAGLGATGQWADADANQYVGSMEPTGPGRVDGGGIFFQNVTHSSAVVRWAPPELGDWDMGIEGYRLRIRSFLYTEEMFDLSLTDPGERYRPRSLRLLTCASQRPSPLEGSAMEGLPAPALQPRSTESLRVPLAARSTSTRSRSTV